ncbi:cytochrome b/b6 domain-containing protein [Corynebacterium sp.]|uniref:cytochrome b/b6 domain-containing protein n=1 Tax=Corynebacterium sp. TaxID=1720 RepID=UPI002A90F22E|nr:cytochrome b/b6 domain-containing protein [Corynebacterium sp.]MDY5784718.1 cytochrome b/b6 domain-containing protein [Corynebacterium sp.]
MQVPLRRGLPRVAGGDSWPPAGAFAELAPQTPADSPAPGQVSVALRRGLPRVAGGAAFPPAGEVLVTAPPQAVSEVAQPVPAPEAAPTPAPAAPEPAAAASRFSGTQVAFGLVSLGFILGLIVLLARFVLSSTWGSEFVATYDGLQPLPENAPVGLPAWLNWAHFFNMFLMTLIVKTGIQVRGERRPAAYWTPKGNPRGKISLTLWLHLMLDVAWLVLGAVFYVLLFTTGQWMRIVPTSWETIPHAISAGLQYAALDWPTEDPWVHYNALQELSYFAVVFIAAPIAAVSGLRMSPWWPKNWTFFPVALARRLHFPTMVFFLVFIVVHVLLVISTGLQRNLNAMFAATNSDSVAGIWFFMAALAAIALAWWAARPAIVAPLARLTGTVSHR